MGAGAEASVLRQCPVFQVVAGLPAHPGEVGNLVLEIAEAPQIVHGEQIHVGLGLVIRQTGGVLTGKEGRPLFHLQAVAAQVLRGQADGGRQIFLPALHGLVGQAVNEVQGQIVKFGLPGGLHGGLHLLHGVDATDLRQFRVAGGLHAQGQPVESGFPESPQGLPVAGGVGVGLQSDLRVLGNLVFFQNELQNFHQPLFPQIAGGAAAEVDGVHQMAGGKGGGLRQMGTEGIGVFVHAAFTAGQGVEVAIGAFVFAEGNMDIEPQGLPGGFHDAFLQYGVSFLVYRVLPPLARTHIFSHPRQD